MIRTLYIIGLLLTANLCYGQSWTTVGNGLQRKIVGSDTTYRFNLGAPGFWNISSAISGSGVTSFNGRTGAVVPLTGDYSSFYPLLNGTGATGTWGINVTGNAGTVTNGVYTNGSYSNPSWITSLAWGKITGTPTTLSGYGITDAVPSSRTLTINGTTQDLSANRTFTVTASTTNALTAGYGLTGSSFDGSVARTWTADTTVLSTKNYVNNFASKAFVASTYQPLAGRTTLGQNFFTLANPSAITFPRINADNSVSTLDAASFRTAIGAGTSTVIPAALTKTDDTNVTLTLGGTPSTALLQATSLTLGWSGTLSGTRGGTGVNNGSSTITLGGNLTTSGAFPLTLTTTGSTNVTLPTSGTLLTTTGSGASLTNVVNSITGTANQITASASTGAVTLSLPSTLIAPGSLQVTGALTGTSATFSGLLTGTTTNITSSLTMGAVNNVVKAPIFWTYSNDAASRSWAIINDQVAFGDFQIQQSTTQTGSTYSTKMYFSPIGNVGIGATNPQTKLETIGTIRHSSGALGTNGVFFDITPGSSEVSLVASYYGGGGYQPIKFYTGGTVALTIAANQAATFASTVSGVTASPGDNSTKFATTAYVDNAVSSGTYTPALTNGTNVASSSIQYGMHWQKIGSEVSGGFSLNVTTTSTGSSTVSFSLPTGGQISSIGAMTGTGTATSATQSIYIDGNTTSDLGEIRFNSLTTSPQVLYVQFRYTYTP